MSSESDLPAVRRLRFWGHDGREISPPGKRRKTKPHESLLLSPLSIALVMGTIHAGANGITRKEITDAIFNGFSLETVNKWITNLLNNVKEINVGTVVFVDNTCSVKEDYKASLVRNYKAIFKEANFASASEKERIRINEQISKATKGQIREIISHGKIGRDTRIVVANGIHFKREFEKKFPVENTKPGPFYNEDNTKKEVTMMKGTMEGRYFTTNDFVYADFGFSVSNCSFFLLIPKGVNDIFATTADFSAITDEHIHIDFISHQAIFDLDEKGVTAAATSACSAVSAARGRGFPLSRALGVGCPSPHTSHSAIFSFSFVRTCDVMHNNIALITLSCALVALPSLSGATQCQKSDFVYEYLNCDNEGKRWRVAVPRSHQLKCDNVPPPVVGINCTFACPAGHFLDVESQECRQCQAGTYSLGGGIRYDEFENGFPSGFSVENYNDDTEAILHGDTFQETCSPSAGWVIQNSELRYMPTACVSKLSIQVHLVTAGYIEIVYRMPRESRGLLLNINVKNEQCQTYRSHLEDAIANAHSSDRQSKEWQIKRVNLRTGQNVVSLTVSNNRELTTLADVIYVAKIDIVGIAFTKRCTKCPAGTYSENSATVCTPCMPGYFSQKGSSQCSRCKDNSFSGPKASRCRPKPPCEKIDFYKKFDTCTNNEMNVRYVPFQPSVCNDDVPSSYVRPSTRREKCSPCSVGMYRDGSGKCRFCSEGEYSDDGLACKKCPEKSIPNSGYFYNRWEALPANMETGCEFVSQEEVNNCRMDDAWVPQGDYIQSSNTRSNDVVLELVINVSTGFKNYLQPEGVANSVDNPVAFIEFEFETQCADLSCTLYFVADPNPKSKRGIFQVINIFNGTQPRQKVRHPVIGKKPARFIFAFIRSGTSLGESVASDVAKIYTLNITNIDRKDIDIGADRCLSCPMFDVREKVCHPCPPGHFINVNENTCVQCPKRSILNMTSSRYGIASCLECGLNLVADKDHVECIFDGELKIADEQNNTVKHDLSGLRNKSLSASGIRVFAREGNSYYHGYNLTVFGGLVPCREQFKDSMFGLSTLDFQSSDSMASVCRSTALPIHEENSTSTEKVVYVSPAPLAQRLIAVTTEHSYGTVTLTDKDMEYDTISEKNRPTDIHFYYEPIQSSLVACRNGTAVVITARCDPHAANLVARLPKSCPDGTCDGCLYHIIIETSMACPICEANDFDVIKGEHCILTGALSKERVEPCSVITANMQLLFAVLGTLTIALVISIAVICQRNRSLEYKYMKLVESKVGSNGIELPMAESCALGSDEDEEEETSSTRVFFGRKGKNDVYASLKSKNNRAGTNRDDASGSSFLNASAD
ncbi:hypothetical protein QR680_003378 [Steinernema hermaphroditum]|uniref:Serpin domain-containing protein n=1 Tax=Steinernema hermaphroditum TaxID=289476 RepID=A0AA39H934_9BILA|nr:hypothetical protein QR680_003378 [Steinernema hermaphroditum]